METGPAVVGPVGGGAKVEYGAFGNAVSVAAALQSSARPGSVLVGPATRAVTGHLFSWGAAEEVALSGHPRRLVASYLDAPRARVAERRPRLGGRATLVDRDAEMRVLDGALRAAVSGHGSVVLLTAEPGLGKTRLVQECRKRFIAWVGAGSGRLPLWLEGRCASYASAVPYSLYRQLVASWVGVSPDQPEALLRPALETALAHLMGNTNLLPPLARMMGAARGAERQAQGRIGPEELQRMTFGKPRAGSSETSHHFIGDHQDSIFVAELANAFEISIGRNENAVCSGDRLEDERGDGLRAFELNRLLDRGERSFGRFPSALDAMIRIEHVNDARNARLGGPSAGIAGKSHRSGGCTVIGAVAREDLVASGEEARELDRVLVGFGPAVGEEEGVDIAEQFGKLRAKARADSVAMKGFA